jgi:8-oxo-dGTP diphosphatase
VGGTFGIGEGEEFSSPHRGRGIYEPIWVAIDNLSLLDVRPREMAKKIQKNIILEMSIDHL